MTPNILRIPERCKILGYVEDGQLILEQEDIAPEINTDAIVVMSLSRIPMLIKWLQAIQMQSLDVAENPQWVAHAYPLKQLLIKVQGTRHHEKHALIGQLEDVIERLKKGDVIGHDHDDDFGYSFEYKEEATEPTFFKIPAGSN